MHAQTLVAAWIASVLGLAAALDIDVSSQDLVCQAANVIQSGEWNYYTGTRYGGTVGMFDGYYWWLAGQLFAGLIDYYTFCDLGNDTLKQLIYDGVYHQRGENDDYMPLNQLMTEGNDDQGMWGITLMEAVERNFTNPPDHSWLLMAQAVFNTMSGRWDPDSCGGGLRWQIFSYNSGYDYKNLILSGCLFNVGARIARYLGPTSNYTKNYTDTCDKVWRWMEDVGFFQLNQLAIWDGAKIHHNCLLNETTFLRWSYTYGVYMAGAAYLYNLTNDQTWHSRSKQILDAGLGYFKDGNGTMQETTCAPRGWCNDDQRSFRALWLRSLHQTMVLIPEFEDDIRPYIERLARGAVSSCNGGTDGITCGTDWSKGSWDGVFGLGEQQSALEVVLAVLAGRVPDPLTANTGGVSELVPDAGITSNQTVNRNAIAVHTKDKAGAGFITALVLILLLGASAWMLF